MSIKDYFSFTRGEKRGITVLLSIIVLLIIANYSLEFFKPINQTDFSEFEDAINQFEKELSQETNTEAIKPFEFNPNTITDMEWKMLGFKDWQIKTINNYKLKGGTWRIKSDVKKIYGLDSTHFEVLRPFILLPETIKKKNSKTFSKYINSYNKKKSNEPKHQIIIDINQVDTTELKKLKGIGSVYAKRIVKFRDALGGFISLEQLKEVYGLKEETYNLIEPHLTMSHVDPKQININTASAKDLKNHPYIDWKIANVIEKYRLTNGNYLRVEDLKKIHIINENIYSKIEPYLSTE